MLRWSASHPPFFLNLSGSEIEKKVISILINKMEHGFEGEKPRRTRFQGPFVRHLLYWNQLRQALQQQAFASEQEQGEWLARTLAAWQRMVDHWKQISPQQVFPWDAFHQGNLPNDEQGLLNALSLALQQQQGWISRARNTIEEAWQNRQQHLNNAWDNASSYIKDQDDRSLDLLFFSRHKSSDARWREDQRRLDAIRPLTRVRREDLWSNRLPNYVSSTASRLGQDAVNRINELMDATFNENQPPPTQAEVDGNSNWLHRVPGLQRLNTFINSELERKERWLQLLRDSTRKRKNEEIEDTHTDGGEEDDDSSLTTNRRSGGSRSKRQRTESSDFGSSKEETQDSKQDLPLLNQPPVNPVIAPEREWTFLDLLQGPLIESLGLEYVQQLALHDPQLLTALLAISFEDQQRIINSTLTEGDHQDNTLTYYQGGQAVQTLRFRDNSEGDHDTDTNDFGQ